MYKFLSVQFASALKRCLCAVMLKVFGERSFGFAWEGVLCAHVVCVRVCVFVFSCSAFVLVFSSLVL